MLIVIEGVDGSGKQTHTRMLCERLRREGRTVHEISFPDYASPSSEPIKMYLGGAFGSKPEDVSPYAASTFYAVDRFASYRTKWQEPLERGELVVADRYVTSNMIHQGCKLSLAEQGTYFRWLEELEYEKMGLPRPDLVFFLNMPPRYAQQLTANRENKITGEAKKDIHESDREYLKRSYETAYRAAKFSDWQMIDCTDERGIRPLEEIAEEIYKITERRIGC